MAVVGPPIWQTGVWADSVWAAGVWESSAGATPLTGDRTTAWAKYMDANGWGNDRYRAAISSTGDLTTDAAEHINQG